MTTTIRQMIAEEYSLLEEFLYQAIFVPQGLPAPDRSIIQLPELQL
ncbi:GNAT family N-acetyltransferase [Streptococcus mutans]|nr:putative fR47-like protein [Streptococcus mutans]